jgi:hypothetical protein
VIINGCTVSGYDVGSVMSGSPIPDQSCYSCGSIKFGTESYGGFKNITITDCTFERSRGFMLATVDGGDIENIYIDNIQMSFINDSPIFLRLGNWGRGPGNPPPGTYRNVNISNVTCSSSMSRLGCIASGIPGHCIEDVNLSNLNITYIGGGTAANADIVLPEKEDGYPYAGMFGGTTPSYAFYLRHAKEIELHDCNFSFIIDDSRPAFALIDVNGFELDNVNAERYYTAGDHIKFDEVDDVNVHDCNDFPLTTANYTRMESSEYMVTVGEPFTVSISAIPVSTGICSTDMIMDSTYFDTEYSWINAGMPEYVKFSDIQLYSLGKYHFEIDVFGIDIGICPVGDFDFSGKTNSDDYSIFATDWMTQLPQLQPSGDPVAWWKLDEESGGIAFDSSGNENHGTLYNMENSDWVTGKFEGALQFDGWNEYILVDDDPTMDFGSGSFTISAWIKPTNSSGHIIINGTSGSGYSGKRYCLRSYSAGSTLELAIDDNITKSIASGSGLISGQWHHIVALLDTTGARTKGLNIYIDGVFRGNGTNRTGNFDSPGEPVYIGKEGIDGFWGYLPATLDDIRLYNYALTDEEIRTLLEKIYIPLPPNLHKDGEGIIDCMDMKVFCENWLAGEVLDIDTPPKEPIAWWKLDSDTDDSTAYQNHGIIYGDPCFVAGQINGALNFNGVGDYVNIETSLFNLETHTTSFWMQPRTLGYKIAIESVEGITRAFGYIGLSGDGQVRHHVRSGTKSESNKIDAMTESLVEAGDWYHIVSIMGLEGNKLYVNGTEQTLTYLNGSPESTESWAIINEDNGPNNLNIGCLVYDGVGNEFFDGVIDDVRIYDEALTQEDIDYLAGME